jgi:hypothetical protein
MEMICSSKTLAESNELYDVISHKTEHFITTGVWTSTPTTSRSLDIFSLPNPSSRTLTLGFAQRLIETSIIRSFWGGARPVRKADNFPDVDDVHTSQEAHLWAFRACYWDSSILLYVDNVCTSQKTHIRASTTCYEYIFTIYGQVFTLSLSSYFRTKFCVWEYTTLVMRICVYWDVTPCSSLKVNRCFGGTYSLSSG